METWRLRNDVLAEHVSVCGEMKTLAIFSVYCTDHR
jgi:hypothetical protein